MSNFYFFEKIELKILGLFLPKLSTPMPRIHPFLQGRPRPYRKPQEPEPPSLFEVIVVLVITAIYASLMYCILESNNALPEDGVGFACICIAPPVILIGAAAMILQCIIG